MDHSAILLLVVVILDGNIIAVEAVVGKIILVELLFLGLVFLNGILEESSTTTATESADAVTHLLFLTYAQLVASNGPLLVGSKETIPVLMLPRFFNTPMFQTPKSILYQMAFLFVS